MIFIHGPFTDNPFSAYGNCQLVFNLTFCDQVAYAVPSNNQTFPDPLALGQFYDNYTVGLYEGFNKSMQLIPCEADDTQQYSLVRNCSTCHGAYRNWLCSVTIPRCEDFSNTAPFLQPRGHQHDLPRRRIAVRGRAGAVQGVREPPELPDEPQPADRHDCEAGPVQGGVAVRGAVLRSSAELSLGDGLHLSATVEYRVQHELWHVDRYQ